MPNVIYTCFVTLEIQHMNRCYNLTHVESLLAKNITKFQTDLKNFWGTNNKRMGVQQSSNLKTFTRAAMILAVGAQPVEFGQKAYDKKTKYSS